MTGDIARNTLVLLVVIVFIGVLSSGVNLFTGWLIFVGLFFAGCLVFDLYKKENKKTLRVEFLNARLKGLGGSPIGDYGSLMLDSTYNDLVSSLEKSILDIFVNEIISFHSKTLTRKKKQKIYTDDYGRGIYDEWLRELEYFAANIFIPHLERFIQAESLSFDEVHVPLDAGERTSVKYWSHVIGVALAHVEDSQGDYSEELGLDEVFSGHDYEHFISGLIKEQGWSAQVTSGSGDHGADVIIENGFTRIAVQCKYYSSPVGNKSVQEAYSAKDFYDCNHACVVTNSTYTPAAKKAASKLGVSLLHHSDIQEFLQNI